MEKDEKRNEMAPKARERMIETISRVIKEVDDQKLQRIYILVIHIQ